MFAEQGEMAEESFWAPVNPNSYMATVNSNSYVAPVNLDSYVAPVNLDSFEAPKVIDTFEAPSKLNPQDPRPVQNSNVAQNNPSRAETGRLSSVEKIPDRTSMEAGNSRLQNENLSNPKADIDVMEGEETLKPQPKQQNTNFHKPKPVEVDNDYGDMEGEETLKPQPKQQNTNFQKPKPVLDEEDMEYEESLPGQSKQQNAKFQNPKPAEVDYAVEEEESFPDRTSLTAGQPRPQNTIHQNSKQKIFTGRKLRPKSSNLLGPKRGAMLDDEEGEADEDVKEAMDELEKGSSTSLTMFGRNMMYYAIIFLYALLWFCLYP